MAKEVQDQGEQISSMGRTINTPHGRRMKLNADMGLNTKPSIFTRAGCSL